MLAIFATNAQGQFSLKVARRPEDAPKEVIAVAPDYFARSKDFAGEIQVPLTKRLDSAAEMKDRDYEQLLTGQSSLLRDSHLDCLRAKSKEDAAGAVSALRILKESYLKYDLESPRGMRNNWPSDISRQIFLLESLPSNGAGAR